MITRKQTCKDCGQEYEAKMSMGIDISGGWCPECRLAAVKKDEAEQRAKEQLAISQERQRWRQNCGIPPKFMNEEFGTFETERSGNVKKAYEKCLDYAKGFPLDYAKYRRASGKAYPSIMLFSDNVWGIGKTHLVCSIAHNIINRYNGESVTCPVIIVNEPELYQRIRATYNYTPEEKQYRETEEDILHPIMNKPLLILDDVGKEEPRDPKFVRRVLYDIINWRYEHLLPVVITTNLTPESLKLYVGTENNQATYDRLWEMCGGGFFKMAGESYRRK